MLGPDGLTSFMKTSQLKLCNARGTFQIKSMNVSPHAQEKK